MASSVSSTCTSPTRSPSSSSCCFSSTLTWRYDVFLSFSGLDTRNNFSDHLYRALVERGFRVFRDDKKLRKGEEISESIFRAISSSRFSIVVLSRNYAGSQWCLDELVKIISCRNEKLGHVIFPVFYHVSPDHVLNQIGCFGKFFVAHERKFGKERVQRWRAALTDIAGFCGWDVPNYRQTDIDPPCMSDRQTDKITPFLHYSPILLAEGAKTITFTEIVWDTLPMKRLFGNLPQQSCQFTMVFKMNEKSAILLIILDLLGVRFTDEYFHIRSESKLVRIIVEKLSQYLKCSSQNSGSDHFVPLSCKVKPMEFYSYEGLGNIGIVRICGMDGMRRTTMARVAYDAVINEKWGKDRFQELVCEMPKECSRYIWDINTVINAIRKKMVYKKVLLLVDHVDALEQVASMVRKHAHSWVIPKSRIIVSAATPNKTTLNALDISFHLPETTEHNLFLDIACFVVEMDDSHVTRIIRSLVSTNLCANSGMEVLINKTLINIFDYDKPLNIEEPTSLDMFLDMGSTRDNKKSSESNSKTKNRATYGSVDIKSGNRQIQKQNLVKSSVTASQKESLDVSLPVRNTGKSEARSKIGTHKLQPLRKFVEDARNSAAFNASGDAAIESQGVNIERNPILDMANMCSSRKINETELLNSLAAIPDDCIYECDTVSPRKGVCSPGSEMLFSSKAKDKKLQYFMPEIVNGKKIVRIPEAVRKEGIKQWELCLVGQLLGKCSEISLVLNEANQLWGKEGRIQVTKMKDKFYIFKFPNENIRDLVLESGPWCIANKPLVLRMWQPDMRLSELDNSKIPVWVKLSGIPMEYMTTKGVSYIASALGTPLYTATCCLDFVKVCVVVSIEDDIMDFITVTGCDGEELSVEVEYLWKPEKCITCKEFGHSFLECPNLCCTDTPF